MNERADAVSSLVYEANARMRDPVYGCVGAISYLQNQVMQLQMQLAMAQAEILCIQMQSETPQVEAATVLPITPDNQLVENDHDIDKSFFLSDQYLNFDSTSHKSCNSQDGLFLWR